MNVPTLKIEEIEKHRTPDELMSGLLTNGEAFGMWLNAQWEHHGTCYGQVFLTTHRVVWVGIRKWRDTKDFMLHVPISDINNVTYKQGFLSNTVNIYTGVGILSFDTTDKKAAPYFTEIVRRYAAMGGSQ